MAHAASKRRRSYKWGQAAETCASVYLQCKGYRILDRRMRNHCGEIDIIAAKKDLVIAVEVKARQRLSECAESITPQKQHRISRAMSLWLAHHKNTGLRTPHSPNIRFDVIWITPYKWPKHIKDAWR